MTAREFMQTPELQIPSSGERPAQRDVSTSPWTVDEKEKAPPQEENAVADWDGPDDPSNPFNFSNRRKWIITGTAVFGALLLPLNGTSITVAADQINHDFQISDERFQNSFWPVTSWSLGSAVFIILFLPLMEDLGVRLTYLIFYTFFMLMLIPQAVAQNFVTLIVARFFSGGCVTLLANVASSTIPDMFLSTRSRSLPVSLYIVFYVTGSTLGPPIFAGIVKATQNWRWIFYVQLILYGAFFPVAMILIKETRGNVILRRRAAKSEAQTGKSSRIMVHFRPRSAMKALALSAYRPLYLVVTEPVLAVCTLWSAFAFGTVFLFTQSVEQVFKGTYGWPSYMTGYVQISVVIGEFLGWLAQLYGSRLYLRSAKRNKGAPGAPIPEARLYISVFGSFFGMAGGMFVYAWTARPNIPWVAPAVGLVLVGFGIETVVAAAADYLEDAYAASSHAASAISAVAAGESIVAGFLPLSAKSMYVTLGYQWASSLLGLIALLLSLAPVVFIWKGPTFRAKSPYMLSKGSSGIGHGELRFSSEA